MKSSKPKGKPKPSEFELVGAGELIQKVQSIARGEYHLSTITGIDTGERIEVLYHFELLDKMLTLRVPLDRNIASVETITNVMPSAVLYEREVVEMLGVEVRGHPRPVNTIIADEYSGEPPLKKSDSK
ncbi:MAG: NADH-quinone oxidoreductase subunit C [Candidatus Micrarchaeota archaeon]